MLNATPSAGKLRRLAGARAVVGRREQHEPFTFSGLLRGVAARPRTAERPRHQADAIDAAQRADVVHRRADVVPVGGDRGHRVRIRRRARRLRSDGTCRLRFLREVARDRSSAPAGSNARSRSCPRRRRRSRRARDTPSSCSPARHVEGHLGRRARAVDEQHDAIGRRRAAPHAVPASTRSRT